MAWNDRIREAAYTAPSGTRLTFDYEDVSRSFDKKTTSFEFPDADGTYVQDLGRSGRRYPLRVFIWGEDYDQQAAAFEAALMETGTGRLEHPIYGVVDVVPFGSVTRRDDLKTAANQAVIQVTFWETIGLIYPSVQGDPASVVVAAVDEYNAAAAAEFDEITSLDSAVEQASFKASYTALIDSVSGGLQAVADTQDDVRKQFNAIVDSINTGIDILVGDPVTLAFQTALMIQAPARALTSIEARLVAYNDLMASVTTSLAVPGNDARNSNDFHTKDLYASTYATGAVVSVVNNQFTTRTDAIAAAEALLDLFDGLVVWRDANYQSLAEVDTGAAYQQLQEAVALAAGFLVEISFTLLQERRVVLDQSHTIVDLAFQLYGGVDEYIDFLISSNDLSGSEILEVPRGREIVYYV